MKRIDQMTLPEVRAAIRAQLDSGENNADHLEALMEQWHRLRFPDSLGPVCRRVVETHNRPPVETKCSGHNAVTVSIDEFTTAINGTPLLPWQSTLLKLLVQRGK